MRKNTNWEDMPSYEKTRRNKKFKTSKNSKPKDKDHRRKSR